MSRGEPHIDVHDVRAWIQGAEAPEDVWQVDKKEVLDWIDWQAAETYAARADEEAARDEAGAAWANRDEAYRAIGHLINGINEMVDSLRHDFPEIPEV